MRLFVAVNLPEETRRSARAATRMLRESRLPVKWVDEDALHVTLKFLGEVAKGDADAIGRALGDAVCTAKPFELGLGGLGAFPDSERPRVFWLGVERHPALELLANDVERALAPLGFESELKPFQPHVTLGRARKTARPNSLADWAGMASGVEYADVVPVENVDLMESVTGRSGPTYRLVHRAPLARRG
ncbi:MAG: RNA 2',3'-cyclic phosphodiesterase [Gemmatimonadales bacterium]